MRNDFRNWRRKYCYLVEILFAVDCPREDIWRRDIYPEYKATRTHAEDFDREIFKKVFDFIEREKNLMIRMIGHPRLEADDICYILSTKLEEGHILIIANDNDYLQLCSSRVSVINKEGREIKDRGCGDAKKDLLRKILTGDKSDNIPGICKGMGPKTADKLIALSPEEFEEWMTKKGPDTRANYERNLQLIDMSRIPQVFIDEVCVQQNLTPP
jgi:5'-3' exonuclease